jgi:hypothetical protein
MGVFLLTTVATRAPAITSGQLDNDAHPYVAMVVAYFDYMDVDEEGNPETVHLPLWRGTGTLISPSVVATAGSLLSPFQSGEQRWCKWGSQSVETNP